ncbi:MAG TPA: phage baseplate assembly protein V [Hymenobacter sp.]|nr:phage baseplate assembly protein V [Hymenobacter sp.]
MSTPYSGAGKGQLFTPEVGSQVLVGYEHNRAEWPLVLSNLFHAKNKAGAKYTHNGGEVKGIQTIAGNRVTFHDKKGEEKIVITNGNKKETAIKISFKGKGKVEIKTQGDLSFTAGQNVAIEAGSNVSIKAGKKMALEAEELSSKTSKATAIKASTKVTVAGSSGVDVKGKLNQSA